MSARENRDVGLRRKGNDIGMSAGGKFEFVGKCGNQERGGRKTVCGSAALHSGVIDCYRGAQRGAVQEALTHDAVFRRSCSRAPGGRCHRTISWSNGINGLCIIASAAHQLPKSFVTIKGGKGFEIV